MEQGYNMEAFEDFDTLIGLKNAIQKFLNEHPNVQVISVSHTHTYEPRYNSPKCNPKALDNWSGLLTFCKKK